MWIVREKVLSEQNIAEKTAFKHPIFKTVSVLYFETVKFVLLCKFSSIFIQKI